MEKRVDKTTENDLMKQVKSYVFDGRFDKALDIIEQMDVNRIRIAPSLCLIGEVYMREKMYEDAENVFLKAYAKSPKNRRILSLLTSLYIEMGDYPEAEYYYKEFIGVASRDLHRYILRYRLDRAKGERKSVLIDTLERLKDYEYIEEWAYELANLYHEAGEDDKCIQECDEIVLWFGNGEYVNKAIELKCEITGEKLPDYLAAQKQFGKVPEALDGHSNDYGGFDIDIVEKGIREEEERKNQWNMQMAEISEALDAQAGGMRPEKAETLAAAEKAKKAEATEEAEEAPMSKDDFFKALSAGDTRADFWKTKERKSEDDEIFEKYGMSEAEALFEEDLDDDDDDFIEENLDDDDDDFIEENLDDDDDLIEEDLDDDDDFIEENLEDSDSFDEKDFEAHDFEKAASEEVLDDDGLLMDEDDIVEERVWTAEDKDFIANLFDNGSKTESNILSTVPNIDYVKEQLSRTFTKFEETTAEKFDILAAYDINFVVLSTDKSMKLQIALGIAKALNTYGLCDKSKIVRASAETLNSRDFSMIFDKIKGGCLIIEKADLLSDKSVSIIEWEVNKENQKTAIVLESFHDEMMAFWKKHQSLRSKFLNVINVSKYNEMELVTLAKGYIEQKKYEMDPEVALILRDYFGQCLEENKVINYEDVMSIVDVAITNVENRNSKNLFMTVLENRYEEASMFKLLPEDFKFLKNESAK